MSKQLWFSLAAALGVAACGGDDSGTTPVDAPPAIDAPLATDGTPLPTAVDVTAEIDGREAIILTRPHVVAEFFHLDWTSKARRRLGVPILHLLEHESFDEQAEGYGSEGVTGL